MKRYIGFLAGALAIQVVLAAGLSLTGPSLAAFRPDVPLFDLAGATVDRLIIENIDDEQTVLTRQDDDWVLSDTSAFPADNDKVDRLLERLQGLKRGMAVATSESAHKRFKVTDDEFERRVTLATGDETLATLYLGTSPGAREVHVRVNDDDAIYTVPIGIYDASADSDDWLDKTVLQIPVAEIDKVTLPEFTLSRVTETTTADNAQAEETKDQATHWTIQAQIEDVDQNALDQANVNELVRKLAQLRIDSVLGSESMPEYGLDEPTLIVGLRRTHAENSKQERIEYRLAKREDANDYVLKSSLRDEYFLIAGYLGDSLIEAAKQERLLPETSAARESESSKDEAVEG